MILMVHLMQKYIFSKVKSSHNAQNAQKWPPKYPKRPKTVQNPKWPKNFKRACDFFWKEHHIRGVVHFFLDFCSQNPHFWAKNPKKCIFEEIAKISVHNCSNLKIFAYLICQKYDFYHLNDVKLYIVQSCK